MTNIEAVAYRDGASDADFMEEAGSGVALVVHDFAERHQLQRHVVLLCGKGNNAGDAYVAGVHLLHLDYDVVALQLIPIEECSPLCRQNHQRFLQEGGRIQEEAFFPDHALLIDGLFGTGFRGSVAEPFATVIRSANQSGLPIIAVDIPSGLNGETGEVAGEAIIAAETAFLGLPKTGFFLNQGWNHVGKLRYVNFGLDQHYIEESDADLIMLTASDVQPLLPPSSATAINTSEVSQSACQDRLECLEQHSFSSLSALRGGAGIVKLLHPEGMQAELSNAPYELIKLRLSPR